MSGGSCSGSCFPREIPDQDVSPEEESSVKQWRRVGDLSRAHSCTKCERCSDVCSMCARTKGLLRTFSSFIHSQHQLCAAEKCTKLAWTCPFGG